MSSEEDFAEQMRVERSAVLKSSGSRGGLQVQQKIGIALFGVMILGGGWYYLNTMDTKALSGAETTAFQNTNGTNYGTLSIAAPSTAPEEEADPIQIQSAPEAEAIQTEDSAETLARLAEALKRGDDAQTIIADLRVVLERSETELENAIETITRLEDDYDAQALRHQTTMEQELRRLELQYGNEIAQLKGELAIALANAGPPDGAGDEQRARLEAARQLRQQQIESDALIFDNSDEDSSRIKY